MNGENKGSTRATDGTNPDDQPQRSSFRKWLPLMVIVGSFLLGFIPTWLESGRLRREQTRTANELRVTHIQVAAANATIDARRGEYEPARLAGAQFFTLLKEEVDLGRNSQITTADRPVVDAILAQRDDIITLLARSDPASAERLSAIYTDLRKVTRK